MHTHLDCLYVKSSCVHSYLETLDPCHQNVCTFIDIEKWLLHLHCVSCQQAWQTKARCSDLSWSLHTCTMICSATCTVYMTKLVHICAHQRPDCGAKISIHKSSCRINIWGLGISSEYSTNKSMIFWLFNFLNICPGKAILKITQILLLKPKVVLIFTTHDKLCLCCMGMYNCT